MARRPNPILSSHFLVDCGVPRPEFTAVQLPTAHGDVLSYRDGSSKSASPDEQPGDADYGRLVLTRRVLPGDRDLWSWWAATRDGSDDVDRNVTVALLNGRYQPVLTWVFHAAFPATYRVSPLEALSTEAVSETVELAFDSMDLQT